MGDKKEGRAESGRRGVVFVVRRPGDEHDEEVANAVHTLNRTVRGQVGRDVKRAGDRRHDPAADANVHAEVVLGCEVDIRGIVELVHPAGPAVLNNVWHIGAG